MEALWRSALEFSLVVAASVLLHELLHYAAALVLGYEAKLSASLVGLAVVLSEFSAHGSVIELRGKARLDYLMIALAPYALAPLYAALASSSTSPALRAAGAACLLYHALNLPLELSQKRVPSLGLRRARDIAAAELTP
ncbi:MAG: hypothetical protein QXU97_04070 [Fervidicoccaceae archaeon]